MEARRLNRRLEQQRLKKIRSLAQKTLDRRAEAKAHDKREENAREVLKRERIERECLDKRIERRQVLKKKRRIGTLIFRNWSERRSEETRAIAWEKLKRKRSAETAHKIRGQKAAARKQRENKESRREESLRSAQAEQRKRERMALHADHRRRSKQWEQRHEKKCAEHKPKLQQKRRRADRPVNRPAPTETGKKDPDRYRIMALKRKKEQAREEQAEMARWEQLRQQKAERREQEKRLANKDPRTEKHSTDEERPKKITSWEQKSAKDLRREELAWVRRREMQREQMKHKTLERRKEALALEKRMDRRKAID
ncbi:MAG: hypothetical protein QNK37_27785 [Acidobacteriota bacterium]|nr:hypothetical protein [Acidobacteriota bacterium]